MNSWKKRDVMRQMDDGSTELVSTEIIDENGCIVIADVTDDIAGLVAAAPELLDHARLFAKCIEYEIKMSVRKGDDEGANLKRLTLNLCMDVIARATP